MKRRAWARWCSLSCISLTVNAAGAGALIQTTSIQIEPIVMSGEFIEGLPPDLTLDLFGTPAIDQDGNVAFLAQSLPNLLIDNLSVWKTTAGGLSLIALNGQQAPGTTEMFRILGRPQIASGIVSFEAEITQPSGFGIDGIWSDRNGQLELVMLQSDHPPLTPPPSTFHSFVHRLSADGSVVINAVYNDHSDIFVELANEGLWRNRTGPLEAVAVRHMPAPDAGSDVSFDAGTELAFFGPIDGWAFSALGRVALQGYLGGPGVTTANDEGIWAEGPRGLGLVVRESDPTPSIPGSSFLADFGFHTFGDGTGGRINMNRHGHVVFAAEIGIHDSLWTNRDGPVQLVAIDGINNPPVPAQPAPGFGPGQFISVLYGGLINDADDIAMLGVVFVPGQQFGVRAIWADHSGVMSLIVRRGNPVPGAPGLLFTNTMNPRGYAPDGTIYFSALVDPNPTASASSASNYGLFLSQPDGTIHTVALTAGAFEVVPGDVRTIAQIFPNFNEPNSVPGVSDDGAITFQLIFTDGSTGLFTARITPQPIIGDLNGDGHVNTLDLGILLSSWSIPPTAPGCAGATPCAADINGDGVVNTLDLGILLAAWG